MIERRCDRARRLRSHRGRDPRSRRVFVPLIVGRPRDRRHLIAEPRPRARIQRARRSAADHPRQQSQRRAGERPAVRGDAAAQRRARTDQRRPARARREPRHAGDVRPRRRPDPGDLRRAGRRHRRARPRGRAHPLPVRDRARGPLPRRADRGHRVPPASARDARARRRQRGPGRAVGRRRATARAPGRAPAVRRVRPADRRRPGHRRHLAPEPRSRARVQRGRRPAPRHPGRQLERCVRERAAVRGNRPASVRARDREQRGPGDRRTARPRRADRAPGRPAPRGVHGRPRVRGAARPRDRPDRVPRTTARTASGGTNPPLRYGEGLTTQDPPDPRAAPAQPSERVRTDRGRGGRHAREVLPRRADRRGERRDRRDQRPEHAAGGPVRRVGCAAALDDRDQRRRRDPERAAVPRDPAARERDGGAGRARTRDRRAAGPRTDPAEDRGARRRAPRGGLERGLPGAGRSRSCRWSRSASSARP